MARTTIALVALLTVSRSAPGGTVITANLPPNTAIINISGTQDGAGNYDGSQDRWFQPFAANGPGALLTYTIQPGTYTFRLTNPSLAASQFPSLTSGQLATIYTAWTYNSPWVTDYMAWDIAAASNGTIPQLFSGAITPLSDLPGYPNATTAFNTAQTKGFANEIVDSPGGRYSGTVKTQRSFAATQTLVFAVPDPGLFDNGGGVSVVISPAANPPGDYNNNGKVDAADYVRWRKNTGNSALPNDNGFTTQAARFNLWRANFGNMAGSGSSSSETVPETAAPLLLLSGTFAMFFRRSSRECCPPS